MTLFGKRVFADGIELRILRGDHPGLSSWAPNPMTSVLSADRREDRVKREAEVGRVQLQASSRLNLEEAGKEPPLEPLDGVRFRRQLDFPLAPRTAGI